MNDYQALVGPVLVVFGGALQWLRQFSAVKDRWIMLIAVVLGSVAYALAHHVGPDLRYEALVAIPLVASYASTVLGGTAVAAVAGKSDAPALKFVPEADSK